MKLRITRDDGNLDSLNPLIVNDLYEAVNEHNDTKCILTECPDVTHINNDVKWFYINIRSPPNHYLELEGLLGSMQNHEFIFILD